MKRIVLAAAVLIIFSTAGQSVNDPTQPVGVSRVAVVNVGHIFHHYERATLLKKEIDAILEPAKQEATKIIAEAKEIEAAIARKDFSETTKEELDDRLRDAKRKLEDMDSKMRKLIGKKQEENLLILWKDVQEGIRLYANKTGIQLVLGYGDPMDKAHVEQFANVNRKMQAMDQGSTVPLFMESRAEIADAVTDLLNKRFREQKARKTK